MRALLISTYEMGRQPFGLASPAAWLRAAGSTVDCVDLSKEPLRDSLVAEADQAGSLHGAALVHIERTAARFRRQVRTRGIL